MSFILLSHSLQYSIRFLLESRRVKGPMAGFSHMKLQKLLYYMQGYHVAALGQPLFPEAIEAWEHGPVVREVWYQFNQYGSADIPEAVVDEIQFRGSAITTDYQLSLINWVYDSFSRYTASQLRDRTHDEMPWKKTYVAGVGNVIPLTLLHKQFRKFV